jgi:protein TonB
MAYVDNSSNTRRTTTAIAVAVIQAGVIYAVATGLAVKFIERPPPDNPLTANPTTITPIPQPTERAKPQPPIPHQRDNTHDPLPGDPDPQPTTAPTGQATEGTGTIGGTGTDDGTVIVDPPKPPPLNFTPRSAKPKNAPGTWATSADYPTSDLRAEHQGVTRFRLSVGTDGKVLGCEVTGTSGFAGLDRTTCDRVTRRARFEPATDGSGARVPGHYAGSIHWQIPD